ncbi:class I SAM-dependent methyltransferase [Rhizobium laguerreae]|uniref:class I SAM-dependent methyltransferase n=1 Tax=Rhizobium laguerreae TaxID=1076926 RepID=UPI001C91915E|nr:class I SAM-dependent methyltransferase [Rhizobium laguerreae]MBY3089639.1 class I SAM-dependent methyltransferase [Rhizobium laguerreae]
MAEEAQKNIGTWYIDPDAEDRMADGHAPIWRHLTDLIVERDLTDKSVLDFGCNQGGLLRHLYAMRPFRKALGIDIAETSIAKAETLKGNLPIQHQVGGQLEGWAEEFDLAISHEVIYLVPDIDSHAADIWRALKPGGVYYAVTGCHTDNPRWPKWRELVANRTNTVVQDRSITDYGRAFEKAAFDVSARKLEYDGFIPFVADGWTPDFADALTYYTQTKTVFRLVKR